ncbi:hypothetical protein AKUH4B102A_14460 [Apilactobacillus kunkeei]|nr:hypothetical protein AKUH4B102A_14460 [Apilactobacillus kunkeei]
MMFNKNQFHKTSDKKVLRKVKKQWVTVSVATLAFLGGSFYLTSTSASADAVNSTQVAQSNSTTENQSSGSSSATTTQASSAASDVASQGSSSASSTTSSASVTASSVASNETSSASLSASDSLLSSSSSDSSDWSNSISASDATLSNRDGDAPTTSSPQNSTVQWDFYGNATDKYQAGTLAIHSGTLGGNNSSSQVSNWNGITSNDVKHIVFDGSNEGSVKFSSYNSGLFSNLANLESITSTSSNNVDTSDATDISDMFENDSSLTNIDALSNWDTSNINNMVETFKGDSSLNDLSSLKLWNVKNVKYMDRTFMGTSSITSLEGLSSWTTSNLESLTGTFQQMTSLKDTKGLSNFDVSKVTSMQSAFQDDHSLENVDDLKSWSPDSINSISWMFYGDTSLSDISGLSTWNSKGTQLNNLQHMSYTFFNNAFDNVNALSSWTVKNVSDMRAMFQNDVNLKDISGLSGFSPNSVTDLSYFLSNTAITNVDALSSWNNTSNLSNMEGMFLEDHQLNNIKGISNLDTSSVTNMSLLFKHVYLLQDISPLSNWKVSDVITMDSMFFDDTLITNVDSLVLWRPISLETTHYMFAHQNISSQGLENINGLKDWKTPNLQYMGYMFENDAALTDISGFENWDVSKVQSISGMLRNSSLTSLSGLQNWKTSSLTDMQFMLEGSSKLTDISQLTPNSESGVWDTSNVTDMSGVFNGNSSLQNVDAVKNWNTVQNKYLWLTFANMSSLTSLDAIKNWNTSNVIAMTDVFKNDNNSTLNNSVLDLSSWDTSKISGSNKVQLGGTPQLSDPRPEISSQQKYFKLGPNSTNVIIDKVSGDGNDIILGQGTGTIDDPNGDQFTAEQLQNKFANSGNTTETYIRVSLSEYMQNAITKLQSEAVKVNDTINGDIKLDSVGKSMELSNVQTALNNAISDVKNQTTIAGVKSSTDNGITEIDNQYQPGVSFQERKNYLVNYLDAEAQK